MLNELIRKVAHRLVRQSLLATGMFFLAASSQAAVTFAAKVDYAAGTNPHSVTTGDFNGDGKTDIATANASADTVSILLGVGDGTFGAKTDFATGNTPISVTTGDFNGDGKADIATGNYNGNSVSILLGVGDGTFGAKTDFATGNTPYSVITGDFNGDGKADIATGNYNGNSVSILLGMGDGTFGAKTDFATGTASFSVTTGDFNNDGKTDIATANIGGGSVSILLGIDNGTFGAKTDFATGDAPTSVTTGDFNNDGKTDIATANSRSNNISILLGNGDGTFGAKTDFSTGDYPTSVTTGDFNGDGKADIATANYTSSNISILINTTAFKSSTFASAVNYSTGDYPTSVNTGDFNGDGKTDIATANSSSNNISIFMGVGDGTFGAKTDFATGTEPYSVTTDDFNNDGKTDIAVANHLDDSVSILLGVGDGTFGAKTDFATGDLFSVTTGDFNNDGKTDIATANIGGDSVSILLGVGDGTFGAKTDFATGNSPASVTTGDFNNDGKTDIATANNFIDGDSVSILLGVGDGTFGAKTDFAAGNKAPFSMTTGDFNNDGKTDIATANSNGNTVSILLGKGDGTFGAKTDFATGYCPRSVSTGDFNNDGKTDIATANSDSDTVSILLGKGNGTFDAKTDFSTGDYPHSAVTTGDFNNDGKADIATANYVGNTVSILINISDTTITTTAIAGVAVPVTGAVPTVAIPATSEYSATISWLPADATFASATVYTATITITAKAGYILTGVAENFFTVAGATATNAANSGVVTAAFPATATTISTAAIAGVAVPVTGAVPTATITDTSEYTATISWLPADATFSSATVYTATITITAKAGYILTGVAENFFTVAGATATNAADSGVVTAVFPATEPAVVTGISVKTPPIKTTYIAGETLDLTGLEVTLTKSFGAGQDVALADFAAYGITTYKANGAVLAVTDTKVVITVNGHTTNQPITVNKPPTKFHELTIMNGSGSGNYLAGTVVVIAANLADAGKRFDLWTGDIASVANVNLATTTVVMPASGITVTATYTDTPSNLFALTVNNGAGSGAYIASGTLVTITANSAATGMIFDQWTGDVTTVAKTDASTTTIAMPAADIGVTATYRTSGVFTVSFQTDGTANAYITGTNPQNVIEEESSTPVGAVAPESWAFVKWTIDGVDYSTDNPLIVHNVAEDMTLTANFSPVLDPSILTVVVNRADVGSVSPASSIEVNSGELAEIVATPADGWHFVNWTAGTGATVSNSVSSATTVSLINDATVTANFAETAAVTEITVNTNIAGAGETNIMGTVEVIPMQKLTIIATPAPGFYFLDWISDNASAVFDDPLASTTQVAVLSNSTVTAVFAALPENACTYGRKYTIEAASATLADFIIRPRVRATYTKPATGNADAKPSHAYLKVWTKMLRNFPVLSVDCEWQKKFSLINGREWNKTKTCSQNLILNPGFITAIHSNITVSGRDFTGKQVNNFDTGIDLPVSPPVITGVFDADGNEISSATAGSTITVKGELFGSIIPLVYLEYPVYGIDGQLKSIKLLRLKVDRKSFIYGNMRGAKSPMDPATGLSQITVFMPKSWPKGWNHSIPHNLEISNKIGRATVMFQTSK